MSLPLAVGQIGLGAIGTGMARRLLAGGHRLTVFARGSRVAEIRAAGAAESPDHAALAAGCDVLVVCLYSDAQVREVLLGQGALAAMRPGAVVALHTTGSPALARALGAAAPAGVQVLDATFSGGPAEAAAGTLTMMVGGDQGALDRALPALSCYAGHIERVGALGQGQTVKLINNLLFATNLMHAFEALRLGAAQGIDPATLARVVQRCSGASFALDRFAGPREAEAALASARPFLEKDVAVAVASAADAGIDLSGFAPTAAYFGSSVDQSLP